MSNESIRLYSLDRWQGMADHDPITAHQGVHFGCTPAQFLSQRHLVNLLFAELFVQATASLLSLLD